MELIKQKLSKKSIRVILIALAVLVATSVIIFSPAAQGLSISTEVYTNTTTAIIRVSTEENEDPGKAVILVPNINNDSLYSVLKGKRYDVLEDDQGQYIKVDIPSLDNPGEYITQEKLVHGNQHQFIIAFGVDKYIQDNIGVDDDNIDITDENVVETGVTVEVDLTAPAVVSHSIDTNNKDYIRNEDTITVKFTTNEAIQTPLVSMLGQSKDAVKGEGENEWTATFTINSSEQQFDGKEVTFSIEAEDLAGNVISPEFTAAGIVFYWSDPKVSLSSIVSNNEDKTYAKNGHEITITFTTDREVLRPEVTILGNGAHEVNKGSGQNEWIAKYILSEEDEEYDGKKVEFTIAVEDFAGNTASQTVTDLSTVTYYCTNPKINNPAIVSSNTNNRYGKKGHTVTVSFAADRKVKKPTFKIMGETVEEGNVVEGEVENQWVATYTLGDKNKDYDKKKVDFTIEIEDLAGNTATENVTEQSAVTYYYSEPGISDLVIVSSNNDPQHAATGHVITVSFTMDRKINDPIVKILGNNADVKARGEVGENQWTASYTLGAEDEVHDGQKVDYTIEIEDLAGNTVTRTVTNQSTVTYDCTRPTASNINIVSDNQNSNDLAKNEDIITVTFTASEPTQKPTAIILGQLIHPDNITSSNNTEWTVKYKLNKDELVIGEGKVDFSIDFKDLASNGVMNPITEEMAASMVTYDRTTPETDAVSIVSSNANQEYAKNEDVITVRFTTKEPVRDITASIFGKPVAVNEEGSNDKTQWIAQYQINKDEESIPEGNVDISISFSDMAGNPIKKDVTELDSNSQVIYDRTPPKADFINIKSNNSRSRLARGGDPIIVSFTTDEDVQTPEVTIFGRTAKVTGSKKSWRAEYEIPKDENVIAEGIANFSIDVKDTAGNSTLDIAAVTDKSEVEYDRTPPKTTAVSISSSNKVSTLAQNGDKITVTFDTDEPIQIPEVNIFDKKAEISEIGRKDGTQWKAEYEINTLENNLPEGQVNFKIEFKDLPGNVALDVTAVSDQSLVNYDRTAPTIEAVSIVKVSGTDYMGWAKDEDTFKVRFTLKDTNTGINPGTVTVKVGNTLVNAGIVSGTELSGVYEGLFKVDKDTLAGMDDYGSFGFVIKYVDRAGNVGTDGTAVTDVSSVRYDNVAPVIKYFFNEVETTTDNLQTFYNKNQLIIQINDRNFDPNTTTLTSNQIKPTTWVDKGQDIWEMAITIPDGHNYTLSITSIDKVGNTNTHDLTTSKTFNMDTVLPVIKSFFNGSQIDTASRYYDATQQVVVQITDVNFDAAATEVSGNGIIPTRWVDKGNNIWEMAISLGEFNDYTLAVKTTDRAANSDRKDFGLFTIDITRPAISINNITPGFFNEGLSARITYNDTNYEAASIKINGVEQALGTQGENGFYRNINISEEGHYKLTVDVRDLAGNTSNQEINFVIDTTNPEFTSTTINLSTPQAFMGGWRASDHINISDDNESFTILACTLNGAKWEFTDPVNTEGKNVLYIQVKDEAGNISELSYQFFLDSTAPRVSFEDRVSGKVLTEGNNGVFVSEMELRIYLEAMEIGNQGKDKFTTLLLKDEDGNVVTDLLSSLSPVKDPMGNAVYVLPLTEFKTYSLVVSAKDEVDNTTNAEYIFTLRDKNIFVKYYENKPLFYTTTPILGMMIIVGIWFGINKFKKKEEIHG